VRKKEEKIRYQWKHLAYEEECQVFEVDDSRPVALRYLGIIHENEWYPFVSELQTKKIHRKKQPKIA